jgi:hypothetical protein
MPSIDELKAALPKHDRLDDLLGASSDPHPRKTRRVEWVGQVSPLDNPIIVLRLLNGYYTPLQEQAIRKAAAHARTRGDSHRIRLLEHDHPGAQAVFKGLKQTYIFSAKNGYVQDVSYEDCDVIFSSEVADEFRDLDNPNEAPDPRLALPREDEVMRMVSSEVVLEAERSSGIIAKT